MTRKDRDFLCWLAGFIDGESCIGCYRRKEKDFMFQVQIGQHDSRKWILEYIHSHVGGNLYRYNGMAGITWTGRKALKLLRQVLPHLVLKRKQAEVLLAGATQWKLQQGKKLSAEEIAFRTKLANSVNAFNFNKNKVKPSQAAKAVNEANEAEGVEVIHELRKGRDDPASLEIAS